MPLAHIYMLVGSHNVSVSDRKSESKSGFCGTVEFLGWRIMDHLAYDWRDRHRTSSCNVLQYSHPVLTKFKFLSPMAFSDGFSQINFGCFEFNHYESMVKVCSKYDRLMAETALKASAS